MKWAVLLIAFVGCGASEAAKQKAERDAYVQVRDDYEFERKEFERLDKELGSAISMNGKASRDLIGSPNSPLLNELADGTKEILDRAKREADTQRERMMKAKAKMIELESPRGPR